MVARTLVSTVVRAIIARLAQSAERKALNLVVVGSSPAVGVVCKNGKVCVPDAP